MNMPPTPLSSRCIIHTKSDKQIIINPRAERLGVFMTEVKRYVPRMASSLSDIILAVLYTKTQAEWKN